VVNQRGLTLISLLVSIAITSLLAVLSYAAIQKLMVASTMALKSGGERDDSSVIKGFFQKSLGHSDVRIFGFTHDPTHQVVRQILPLPGLCANLQPCPDQVALSFVHLDDKTTPLISAVCTLKTSPLTVIVDTQLDAMSTVTPSGTDFNVAGKNPAVITGTVRFAANEILAMADLPSASLWSVVNAPVAFNLTYTAATKTFSSPLFQGNPDCSRSLDMSVDQNYAGRFFAVAVRPLQLSNFYSASALPSAINAMGEFPIRIFNARLMTLGQVPAMATLPQRLAVNECKLQASALTCNNEVFTVKNVSRARIAMTFSRSLGVGVQPETYDILSSSQAPCEGVLETCAPLRVSSTLDIPSLVAGETRDSLLATGFSTAKLEFLREIKVRFFIEREKRVENQTVEQRQKWEKFQFAIP
jgi:Prokaryotic N-terminal methylation motif